MNRRAALKAGGVIVGLTAGAVERGGTVGRPHVVDTNVSLFQWPFRRLPEDDPARLAIRLLELGIAEAWAGSFEAILHRDLSGVNRRVAAACRADHIFRPVGSLHPGLPGWREDLLRCREVHGMKVVRVYPGYHGYLPDAPEFAELLAMAVENGLLVQVVVGLEDVRTQNDLGRVNDVDPTRLESTMKAIPGARVQLLNWRPRPVSLQGLADLKGLYFDTARVEGTEGVPRLIERVGVHRVLLGTHAPFLAPEAALIRTHESGRLETETLIALWGGNAANLLREGAI